MLVLYVTDGNEYYLEIMFFMVSTPRGRICVYITIPGGDVKLCLRMCIQQCIYKDNLFKLILFLTLISYIIAVWILLTVSNRLL